MNNFGVQLFLDTFLGYSVRPRGRDTSAGPVEPTDEHFTGFVFKLQANMDPRHRDKVAFVRVVSGRFERGMKVSNARTKKSVLLSRPSQLFGQDKTILDEGFAGDVIGLNNPGSFAIGDTLYVGKRRALPPSRRFRRALRVPPQHGHGQIQTVPEGCAGALGRGCRAGDVLARRHQTGPHSRRGGPAAVRGGAGADEAGVRGGDDARDLPFAVARWVVGGWDAVDAAGRIFNAQCVKDIWGQPVLLFKNVWNVEQLVADTPEIGELSPFSIRRRGGLTRLSVHTRADEDQTRARRIS